MGDQVEPIKPRPGDIVLTDCHGPCGYRLVGHLAHIVVPSVMRGRIFLACKQCGTVRNIVESEVNLRHA